MIKYLKPKQNLPVFINVRVGIEFHLLFLTNKQSSMTTSLSDSPEKPKCQALGALQVEGKAMTWNFSMNFSQNYLVMLSGCFSPNWIFMRMQVLFGWFWLLPLFIVQFHWRRALPNFPFSFLGCDLGIFFLCSYIPFLIQNGYSPIT